MTRGHVTGYTSRMQCTVGRAIHTPLLVWSGVPCYYTDRCTTLISCRFTTERLAVVLFNPCSLWNSTFTPIWQLLLVGCCCTQCLIWCYFRIWSLSSWKNASPILCSVSSSLWCVLICVHVYAKSWNEICVITYRSKCCNIEMPSFEACCSMCEVLGSLMELLMFCLWGDEPHH